MSNTFKVNGRTFHWATVFQTDEYEPLLRLASSAAVVDVLRISSEDLAFDIAVRVNSSAYADGTKIRHLGPILVLGNGLATHTGVVPAGIMIRIRPRVTVMAEGNDAGADASKLVQWCLSSRFRAVRVTASGGIWNDVYAPTPKPKI
jgi:hypothetical protein